jgi:hypothetical protein
MSEAKKVCTSCRLTRPLGDFYLVGPHRLPGSWCKPCVKAGARRAREAKRAADPGPAGPATS